MCRGSRGWSEASMSQGTPRAPGTTRRRRRQGRALPRASGGSVPLPAPHFWTLSPRTQKEGFLPFPSSWWPSWWQPLGHADGQRQFPPPHMWPGCGWKLRLTRRGLSAPRPGLQEQTQLGYSSLIFTVVPARKKTHSLRGPAPSRMPHGSSDAGPQCCGPVVSSGDPLGPSVFHSGPRPSCQGLSAVRPISGSPPQFLL